VNNDPVDIVAQEERQALLKEDIKRRQIIETDDVKFIMSDKRGRRYIYRVLEQSGIWRISFNTNALTMAFNEGSRNLGLKLLAQLTTHCPESYNKMIEECKNV
jgi:hypothetical protein